MSTSNKRILQAIGGLIALAGATLMVAPHLAYDPGPPADVFAAVERRIPWGGLLGIGAFLMAGWRKPWVVTVAGLLFWLIVGILLARVLGIILDGSHSRQWMWVAVEVVIAVPIGVFLRRRRADD